MLLTPAARADLTIHYKSTFEFSSGLPPQMADAMKRQMAGAMPAESTVRIHGDQVASEFGKLTYLIDYGKQQVILLHPASKRYASLPAADFGKQVEALIPEQARAMMQQMKMDVTAAKSGKTAMVHNVPVEEFLLTLTVDVPNPAGTTMQMKIEVHNWMATAEAVERFPELKQWNTKKWTSIAGLSPAEMSSSAFGQGPFAEKMREAMQGVMKDSTGLMLKSENRVFMPSMGQMLAAQGITVGDGPLMATTMEMDNYTTGSVPAAAFQVPSDYQPAPFADLMKEFNPAAAGARQNVPQDH
ncbi:MAG: hypothetical protein JST11_01240 [Acidobacteria bacterium]|nr:hypothetical protein [Acidobacteriota bacterium]